MPANVFAKTADVPFGIAPGRGMGCASALSEHLQGGKRGDGGKNGQRGQRRMGWNRWQRLGQRLEVFNPAQPAA